MGKIRHVTLGDEEQEKEQKKKAEARREAKKAKKTKTDDAGEVVAAPAPEGHAPDKEKSQETKKTIQPKVRSKKYQEAVKQIDRNKLYPVAEAIALVKKTSLTKFDGSVEIHINLNPNTLGDKKDLRGVVTLPHGTGKKLRVKVADEKIIEDIQNGVIDFDVLLAHPSMMPKLAKVARILGPKGLMPNPKTGTVTPDTDKKIGELSKGQVTYKTEPGNPVIHQIVGKVSFTNSQLTENIGTLIKHIGTNKIAKATLTATMGPGVKMTIE